VKLSLNSLNFLSARSSVFRKMFSNDYKNSKEGEITEISKEAFKDFIKFVYTGEIENMEKHARELLIVADKYKIDELKSRCSVHLLDNLTESDATEIFQCSHKFNCDFELKKASFDLIKR
jgi:speckle-type POZ protein